MTSVGECWSVYSLLTMIVHPLCGVSERCSMSACASCLRGVQCQIVSVRRTKPYRQTRYCRQSFKLYAFSGDLSLFKWGKCPYLVEHSPRGTEI